MFKCSVKVNESMQKELNEKIWIYSLISLIIGSIGLVSYIIVGTFFDNIWINILLWIFLWLLA